MDKAIKFAYHPAWRLVTVLVLAVAAPLLLLTGCGGSKAGSTSTGAARAAASSIAANPTVQADVNQAKLLLARCVKENPSSPKGIEHCAVSQVPRAKRAALLKCLVTTYATDATTSGPKAAFTEFKASSAIGHGAQPCIATALGLAIATATPVPGASANIPGVTVSPSAS